MSLDEQIANLIKVGSLKEAVRDQCLIRQYLVNARQLGKDAGRATFALSRFLLAYEALHALAMAFLTSEGVRTGDSEGRRNTALKLSIGELTKGADFSLGSDAPYRARLDGGRQHPSRMDLRGARASQPRVTLAVRNVALQFHQA